MGVEGYVSSKLTTKDLQSKELLLIKQEIGEFYQQFKNDLNNQYNSPQLLQKTANVLTNSMQDAPHGLVINGSYVLGRETTKNGMLACHTGRIFAIQTLLTHLGFLRPQAAGGKCIDGRWGDSTKNALLQFIRTHCANIKVSGGMLPKSVISTLIDKARTNKIVFSGVAINTTMKSDTPIHQLKPLLINKNSVAIKKIDSFTIDQDLSKVELNNNDKAMISELVSKEYNVKNSGETIDQFKQHIANMIIAAKANNIKITKENMAAICGIWKMEGSYQIDTKKSPQDIQKYIQEIEQKITLIKGLLNDDGDMYFDEKIKELKKLGSNTQGVSQFKIYEWTKSIVEDYHKNSKLQASLNELNSGANEFVFNSALAAKGIKRLSNKETNVQVILRILKSKPGSFGKYEINPNLLEQRVRISSLNSKIDKITAKLFQDNTFNRDGIIRSMQQQTNGSISELELEFVYQKYFFKDALNMYDEDGDGSIDQKNIKFFGLDHNAGAFCCRNTGIQEVLNRFTGSDLELDGDLSGYDKDGKPIIINDEGATYKALKKYCNDAKDPVPKGKTLESEVREFILLGKSLLLQNTALYKYLMKGQERFVAPQFSDKKQNLSAKAYNSRYPIFVTKMLS